MVRAAGRWPAARQTVSVTLGHTRHTSVLASLTSSSHPCVTARRAPRALRRLQHGQILSRLGYERVTACTAARCSLLTSLAHNGPADWETPRLPGVALQVSYRTPPRCLDANTTDPSRINTPHCSSTPPDTPAPTCTHNTSALPQHFPCTPD
ncbi:hypothetical protein E2C01_067397 [Portunus trituberculatus]|uniref:Uncharacterized protein n=1 Tax=Portunus trituberculatus TaxID=210409 RepID=A0A5B7HTH8_PORTR|nr:hypothetical protein [Portunus trituberculatus]